MTPSARVQAAIDLLDAVIAAAKAQGASADRIAAEWFRARRYVGSRIVVPFANWCGMPSGLAVKCRCPDVPRCCAWGRAMRR